MNIRTTKYGQRIVKLTVSERKTLRAFSALLVDLILVEPELGITDEV